MEDMAGNKNEKKKIGKGKEKWSCRCTRFTWRYRWLTSLTILLCFSSKKSKKIAHMHTHTESRCNSCLFIHLVSLRLEFFLSYIFLLPLLAMDHPKSKRASTCVCVCRPIYVCVFALCIPVACNWVLARSTYVTHSQKRTMVLCIWNMK